MALSSDLISQFVQVTKEEKPSKETTVYGTIKEYNGGKYVQLDGSELLTPISITADALDGERVTVMIKDHTATVTGNLSSPSARTDTVNKIDSNVQEIGSKVSEFEVVIADKVSTKRLEAEIARIDTLVSENVTITGRLDANEAEIKDLTADNVTINEKLIANDAEIENLKATKIDADVVEANYANIETLEATNAHINNLEATYGEFRDLTTNKFTAVDASIKNLETDKLDATEAEIKYANIDFANINMAAVKELFAKSGIIKDLVVDNGTIAGELVGVTIKGDLIEGNTIVADKLVVKGEDGLYYKLNTDGVSTSSEQTDYNSLNGTVIRAKSVTAEKIAVEDLVAFGATIGGFHITEDAIYSGVKNGMFNTTRGIYMDDDGQFSLGDSNNFFRYFRDTDGEYKLELSASSLKFTSSSSSIQDEINDLRGELSTVLYIESSQGTIIDNDTETTVLSVTVYNGGQRITDMVTLRNAMGDEVYLEWSAIGLNDSSYETISSDDTRIGNEGFTLTLTQADIGATTTYACKLVSPNISDNTSLAQQAYDLASNTEKRVTDAETSISQNKDAITLCATKEEVQHVEGIAGDAQETATYAESLIKQLADNISMLVTDGNGTSLMTQTEDGWVFSTSTLQSAIDSTSEGLENLTNEVGNTANTVDVLQQAVDVKAGGTGIAFGKAAEDDLAEFGYQAKFTGGIKQVVLPNGTDLNTLLTPNVYSGNNANSASYTNLPFTSGTFTLVVESAGPSGQTKQTVTLCDKNKARAWERHYYTSAWGDWKCIYDFQGSVLWSGAKYMTADHTAELSEKISAQPTGINLVFSEYYDSEAKNQMFISCFVSKKFVSLHNGSGHCFMLCNHTLNYFATKYLYISDDKIVGHDNNNATGTGNTGITYTNNRFVLRYVIGV